VCTDIRLPHSRQKNIRRRVPNAVGVRRRTFVVLDGFAGRVDPLARYPESAPEPPPTLTRLVCDLDPSAVVAPFGPISETYFISVRRRLNHQMP
jgi:hypothetical protein